MSPGFTSQPWRLAQPSRRPHAHRRQWSVEQHGARAFVDQAISAKHPHLHRAARRGSAKARDPVRRCPNEQAGGGHAVRQSGDCVARRIANRRNCDARSRTLVRPPTRYTRRVLPSFMPLRGTSETRTSPQVRDALHQAVAARCVLVRPLRAVVSFCPTPAPRSARARRTIPDACGWESYLVAERAFRARRAALPVSSFGDSRRRSARMEKGKGKGRRGWGGGGKLEEEIERGWGSKWWGEGDVGNDGGVGPTVAIQIRRLVKADLLKKAGRAFTERRAAFAGHFGEHRRRRGHRKLAASHSTVHSAAAHSALPFRTKHTRRPIQDSSIGSRTHAVTPNPFTDAAPRHADRPSSFSESSRSPPRAVRPDFEPGAVSRCARFVLAPCAFLACSPACVLAWNCVMWEHELDLAVQNMPCSGTSELRVRMSFRRADAHVPPLHSSTITR